MDAFALDGSQRAALYANLGRVKAQKTIHDGGCEGMGYRAVYALYLQAFDDEDLADEAQARSMEEYVRQCCGK